ncbi:MAG: PD-(D/E)XK nuclease family protein [Anaerolineae bacterium]
MKEPLILSVGKLATFLACRRRFQLRTLAHLPWPASPLDETAEAAVARGRHFHQLIERHFLGLELFLETIADAQLGRWWRLFQESGPPLPDGRPLPEVQLTLPIGRHLLTGRFDLVVLGTDETTGAATAHIFDWKTGRALDETALKQEWQTRLYLAMLTEGGGALLGQMGIRFNPDNVAITYWYVTQPEAPRTIRYSQPRHAQNWAEIEALVAEIDKALDGDTWPMTEDWSQCRACAYQAHCQRQEAGSGGVVIGNL